MPRDWYVVWHSVAGHHGLHGPYPYAEAQALARRLPEEIEHAVDAVVVRCTEAASRA